MNDAPIRNSKFRTRNLIEVSAAIVFRGGKLLVTQRHADAHLGGLWEFPGGKREAGESFEQCLVREIREELGVEISAGELFEEIRLRRQKFKRRSLSRQHARREAERRRQ